MALPPWPSASDPAAPTGEVEADWRVQGQELIATLEEGREPDVRRPGLAVYHAVQADAPWLATAIRDLAHSVDRPVAINLYLARGGGFPRHWDAHDSVILQVDGARVWSLESRQGPLHRIQGEEPTSPIEAHTRTITLHAGHAVRFPAGWWHQGGDAGSHSAHLTFALGPFGQDQWRRWIAERPEMAFAPAFPWMVDDAVEGSVAVSWPGGRLDLGGPAGRVARHVQAQPITVAGDPTSHEGLGRLATLGLVRPVGWLAEGDADT